MFAAGRKPVTSLYVHVPFCARKCDYCAFYSEVSNGPLIERYVRSLIREMELVASMLKLETVFFGGGTPSILSLRQWEQIFRTMERLGLLGAREWTIECNPATVSADKANLMRSAGVNRISMGVQSLNEDLLDRLGRVHSRSMVFKSFDILRQAGFDNVNLDLMFAIPGQTLEVWRQTLKEALALGSEHLSSYEVIYEEDTALFRQLKAGKVQVDEDLACDMYDDLVNSASAAGFTQYEVANFAHGAAATAGSSLPRRACRHNVNYWRGGDYMGLGPSAASYVDGVRSTNCPNTTLYCERLEEGHRPTDFAERLSPLAKAGEIAAFGLRMVEGWPFDTFRQTTGHDLREGWGSEMDQLTAQGWGYRDSLGFRLTPQGLRFADAAARAFLRVTPPEELAPGTVADGLAPLRH